MAVDSWLDNYFFRKTVSVTLHVLDTTGDVLMLPKAASFYDKQYFERSVFSAGVLVISGSSLGTGILLRNTKVGFVGGTLIIPALVGGVLAYRRVTDLSTSAPAFTTLGFAL